MKRHFLIGAIALFIMVLLFTAKAFSQEGGSLKLGFYAGASNPSGKYRDGVAKAGRGHAFGISADYMFAESNLGIGIDTRMIRHSHQASDTVIVRSGFNTSTTFDTYSSPMHFRHLSFTIGPVYHIGEGRIAIDLYARGGMLFERLPAYVRKETIAVDNPFSSNPPAVFVYETAVARRESATSLTALMGVRTSFEVFPRFDIFLYGDYQTTIGSKGKFVVEDLRNAQNTQSAPIRMLSLGGGIRLKFGDGRDDSSLSRSY